MYALIKTYLQIETSEGGEGEPPLCAGCRIRIQDKYYLCAVEKKWHSSCLKCAECGAELENEASCFEKEGQIYCRDDYLRSVRGWTGGKIREYKPMREAT